MDIFEARKSIDEIDSELIKLFEKRMEISAEIARYKKENDMPVFDEKREKEMIENLTEKADDRFVDYTKDLYKSIFELSRDYQKKLNAEG